MLRSQVQCLLSPPPPARVFQTAPHDARQQRCSRTSDGCCVPATTLGAWMTWYSRTCSKFTRTDQPALPAESYKLTPTAVNRSYVRSLSSQDHTCEVPFPFAFDSASHCSTSLLAFPCGSIRHSLAHSAQSCPSRVLSGSWPGTEPTASPPRPPLGFLPYSESEARGGK